MNSAREVGLPGRVVDAVAVAPTVTAGAVGETRRTAAWAVAAVRDVLAHATCGRDEAGRMAAATAAVACPWVVPGVSALGTPVVDWHWC